jgi:23S rRNA (pseudouridine1915-N3)-methyltransferase
MKLRIIAVGHRMPGWISAGFEDYTRRMPREMPVTLTELKPEVRPANAGEAVIARAIDAEAARIREALPKNAVAVVLDETGKAVTTTALSRRLEAWRAGGRDIAFVIGGADGTSRALQQEADWLWSLSPLTLPHGLVRVLLAEQLYRAASILANHPYHRV